MDGLFRSDDGGNRWRIIHAGLPVQQGHYEFAGLVVDQQNADRIAVAAGDQDGPKDGVFLSDDGGENWTKTLSVRFMGNGPFRWAGTRLAGNRGKAGRLVAASEGDGVWTSDDDGRSWTARGLEGVFFTQVQIDRSDSARVWLCAQTVEVSSGRLRGGFYRSEDGGKNWSKLSDASPTEVVQDPDEPNVLYGPFGSKLMRSRDRGSSWRAFSNGIPAASGPEIDTAPLLWVRDQGLCWPSNGTLRAFTDWIREVRNGGRSNPSSKKRVGASGSSIRRPPIRRVSWCLHRIPAIGSSRMNSAFTSRGIRDRPGKPPTKGSRLP